MLSQAPKKRIPDTAIAVPIVYGSCALFLGKKAHETATHKWTLLLRGPNDEDLSVFISKVAFSLHESFVEPVRVVEKPPYEVTELGWGEFAAKIRIFFRDPEEQPVDIVHLIKLYPQNMQPAAAIAANAAAGANIANRKPVVSETYDEIVFAEPTSQFRQLLLSCVPPLVPPAVANPLAEYWTHFEEEKDIIAITGAQQHIQRELDIAKAKLAVLDNAIQLREAGVN
jgi:YEATS domain-containing protein 4